MASLYTLGTLAGEISDESRVGSDTKFDDIIRALIKEVLIEAIIRDKPREFFRTNTPLSPGSVEINTPPDFLIPDRLVYTSSGVSWELSPEDGPVWPAPISGKPASYVFAKDLVTGLDSILRIYPNGDPADTMFMDYYGHPVFANDNALFLYDRAVPTVKREVLQRLQIIQSKTPEQSVSILQGAVVAAIKPLAQS